MMSKEQANQSSKVKTLHVEATQGAYPVWIGTDVIQQLVPALREHIPSVGQSPLFMITDETVGVLYAPTVQRMLTEAGYRVVMQCVPATEQSKQFETLHALVTTALQAGVDRHSAVIALGGGVVGDLAGFFAATYMRGIPFVQVPTTILAHDSSVGGKVGINHPLAKNTIGAFYPPRFVLYDTLFLQTLPPREVASGLAEVIKHGLIRDASFVTWCLAHMAALRSLDPIKLTHALYTGCTIKASIVSADEHEHGIRAHLNLGHTIGHAIEAVATYGTWTHGEAIAVGMCGSAMLAEHLGIAPLSAHVYDQTVAVLRAAGLPTTLPATVPLVPVLEAMKRDKKFCGGHMVFVLPEAMGAVKIVSDVPEEAVHLILQRLQKEGDPK